MFNCLGSDLMALPLTQVVPMNANNDNNLPNIKTTINVIMSTTNVILTCQHRQSACVDTSETRETLSVDLPWPSTPHHMADNKH